MVQDLALEPGGNSVLVSTTDVGKLFRVNLTTNAVSLVANLRSGLRGITYDNASNLFAVIIGSKIVQVDPTTGAILNTPVIGGSLDGLAFDSTTGDLFAGGAQMLDEISTSLALKHTLTCAICGFIDGVEADGNGNVDLADASAGKIVQFTEAGSTFATIATTPGIDDLAPVAGLGAPPGVPEPGSIILMGTIASLLSFKLKKKVAR